MARDNTRTGSQGRASRRQLVERVGKMEMARSIARECGMTVKEAGDAYDAIARHMLEELRAGKSVSIPGVGSLEITKTAPRVGVRPGTRERIEVPAGRKISFRLSTLLKDEMRGRKS